MIVDDQDTNQKAGEKVKTTSTLHILMKSNVSCSNIFDGDNTATFSAKILSASTLKIGNYFFL